MAQYPTPPSVKIAWSAISYYHKKDKEIGLQKIARALGLMAEDRGDCEAILAGDRPNNADMDAWKDACLQATSDLKLIIAATKDCNEILEANK